MTGPGFTAMLLSIDPSFATVAALGATDITTALVLFFAFCIGHSIADFPLQGEFLARGKNRHLPLPELADGDKPPKYVWIYCLTAHSLIHGGVVWLITGSVLMGLIETVVHWIIDALKSEGKYGFEVDQLLHVATKVVYVALIWAGVLG